MLICICCILGNGTFAGEIGSFSGAVAKKVCYTMGLNLTFHYAVGREENISYFCHNYLFLWVVTLADARPIDPENA